MLGTASYPTFPGPRAGVQSQGLQRIRNLLHRFQRHVHFTGFDPAGMGLIGINTQGPFFL